MRIGSDSLPVLALGAFIVLLILRNVPQELVGAGGVNGQKLAGDVAGLVIASAHHAGCLDIEVAQIGQRAGIPRIQLNRGLKLRAGLLGEREG